LKNSPLVSVASASPAVSEIASADRRDFSADRQLAEYARSGRIFRAGRDEERL
jgi:hypothetical protein